MVDQRVLAATQESQLLQVELRYKGLRDTYVFWDTIMNAHVPDRKQCPLSLLQGWASGTKKFVTKDDVKGHNIPTWPELAVSKLWPAVSADPVLKHYFPDKYAKGKVPEREFFWGILFAVKPGYAKKLVSDALELRAASCMDELGNDRAKKMTIAPEILQKMIDAPYFLAKPRSGRSVILTNMQTRKPPSKKREYGVTARPEDFNKPTKDMAFWEAENQRLIAELETTRAEQQRLLDEEKMKRQATLSQLQQQTTQNSENRPNFINSAFSFITQQQPPSQNNSGQNLFDLSSINISGANPKNTKMKNRESESDDE